MKLWLTRESLSRNSLTVGSSGTMKTSLFLDWADQAIALGWPCVFTDVKSGQDKPSYTSHYYRPGKDFLFNIADARCVNWQLHREFRDPLTALALARRIIPERQNTIPYFIENARNVLRHALGDLGLTISEVLAAINYPSKVSTGLYARLEHGPHGELVAKDGETRQGLLGNLKYALDPFALLPTAGPDFSAYDWASQGSKRTGHIFLSSSRNNWIAQKDLQALLLDLLFVNIQTYPGPGCMFLDEMGIFKSEELEPALSVQRDSGVPIFIACQNFAQWEDNYSAPKKRSILSNPGTKIILRVDGEEAEQAQNLISAGSEIERPRESRSVDSKSRESHTYSKDRPTIKPVPAGVIQSLEPGQGYLVQPGRITPIQLTYRSPLRNQPGFVPRVWPPPGAKKQIGPVSRYAQPKLPLGPHVSP